MTAGDIRARDDKEVSNGSVFAVTALLAAAIADPGASLQNAVVPDAAATPPAAPAQIAPPAKPKLICRRDPNTGSAFAERKVCMTAEQWRRADRQ